MNPTIAYLVAHQHINDLRQEAQHRRRYLEARGPRWIKLAPPRLLARRTRPIATA